MATLKISDLSVGDWVEYDKGNTPYSIRSIYRTGIQDCVVLNDKEYSDGVIGFALGNALDNLATTMSVFSNLLNSILLRTSSRRVRLPQRRTIGKEHRGYARPSRQRIHQRRG